MVWHRWCHILTSFRNFSFDSHGQSITQKAWDNIRLCVWHWQCWHWSLDRAWWPWHWPWGPGGVALELGNIQCHEETDNETWRSVLVRLERVITKSTLTITIHDSFRVKQMFELAPIYSIKDKHLFLPTTSWYDRVPYSSPTTKVLLLRKSKC